MTSNSKLLALSLCSLLVVEKCNAQAPAYLNGITVAYTSSYAPPAGTISMIAASKDYNADINAGYGGSFVWLIPQWTRLMNNVARSVTTWRSGSAVAGLDDLAKGAGGDFRYLQIQTLATPQTPEAIDSIGLYRSLSSLATASGVTCPNGRPCMGMTADINAGRGKDFLYVVWTTVRLPAMSPTGWFCMYFGSQVYIPVRWDGTNTQCMSTNGHDCPGETTVARCQAIIASPPSPQNPLVCGAAHAAIWGTTGYVPGFWCQTAWEFLNLNAAPTCPTGYSLLLGDVNGNGIGGLRTVGSCTECANLCGANPNCRSYECSPTALRCNLNTACEPDHPQYQDYLFCTKDAGNCRGGCPVNTNSDQTGGWSNLATVTNIWSDEACINQCGLLAYCQYWVRQPSTGYCWLGAAVPTSFVSLADRNSGPRCTALPTGAYWTFWTTDGGMTPAYCQGGLAAAGFQCRGSYCDDVRLLCRPGLASAVTPTTYTAFFSEEQPLGGSCGAGVVSGLECNGLYCDNVKLQCAASTSIATTACTEVGPLSEEQAAYVAPAGFFITGMRCTGSYCDNLYLNICPQKVAATGWYCMYLASQHLAVRWDGTTVQCMSTSGVNCVGTFTLAECQANIANPPTPQNPLSCGADHLSKWGVTGYQAGHWCQIAAEFISANPVPTCAAGYSLALGDVDGNGIGGLRTVQSCAECATLCNNDPNCRSYECSPTALRCNLNGPCNPNRVQYQDYLFCSKASPSPLQSCTVNSNTDQAGGWAAIASISNIVTDQDCVAQCSATSQCLYWVRQASSGTCWLGSAVPTAFKTAVGISSGPRCNVDVCPSLAGYVLQRGVDHVPHNLNGYNCLNEMTAACNSDSTCTGLIWVAGEGWGVTKSNMMGTTSGRADLCFYTKAQPCVVNSNTDQAGGWAAISSIANVGSDDACIARCSADTRCQYWVRQPSAGICYLGSAVPTAFVPLADRNSGPRCNTVPETWTRIVHANGNAPGNRLDLPVSSILSLAKTATRIRFCTSGSTTACITSVPNSFPIQMLRQDRPVTFNGAQPCDTTCVAATWTGPGLSHMWNGCVPAYPPALEGGMLAWSCNNAGGLHLSTASGGYSGWTTGALSAIDVFIDAVTCPSLAGYTVQRGVDHVPHNMVFYTSWSEMVTACGSDTACAGLIWVAGEGWGVTKSNMVGTTSGRADLCFYTKVPGALAAARRVADVEEIAADAADVANQTPFTPPEFRSNVALYGLLGLVVPCIALGFAAYRYWTRHSVEDTPAGDSEAVEMSTASVQDSAQCVPVPSPVEPEELGLSQAKADELLLAAIPTASPNSSLSPSPISLALLRCCRISAPGIRNGTPSSPACIHLLI